MKPDKTEEKQTKDTRGGRAERKDFRMQILFRFLLRDPTPLSPNCSFLSIRPTSQPFTLAFFVFLSNLPVSLIDLLSDDPAGSFTRRQPTRQNYRRRFFANHRGAGLPTSDRVLRIVQRSRPGNHVSSWKGKNTIQATELMNSDRLPATVRPPGTTKPRRHRRSRKIFS